jgi:hypothetical protein
MIEFTVNYNDKDLEGLPAQSDQVVSKALAYTALALHGEAVAEAPVDTGRLRGSINPPVKLEELSYGIIIDMIYWMYLQFGTGLHGPEGRKYDIYPINVKALHFYMGTHEVFCRHVSHPGMEANPFITRAIDNTEPRIPDYVAMALREVMG